MAEKKEKDGDVPADGKAEAGLRIRLQLAAEEKGKKLPPFCRVVLENVGTSDLNVQLGYSLGNGKSHHPAALRLVVLDKGKEIRTLTYGTF